MKLRKKHGVETIKLTSDNLMKILAVIAIGFMAYSLYRDATKSTPQGIINVLIIGGIIFVIILIVYLLATRRPTKRTYHEDLDHFQKEVDNRAKMALQKESLQNFENNYRAETDRIAEKLAESGQCYITGSQLVGQEQLLAKQLGADKIDRAKLSLSEGKFKFDKFLTRKRQANLE